MFAFIIITWFLIFFYIFSLLKLKRKYEKKLSKMRSIHAEDWDLPEINTAREKKEVKKEVIEDWKRDNKNTRKHFEKKRNDRKDKGKSRDTPNSGSNNADSKMGKPKGGNGGAWKRPSEDQIDKVIHIYLKKCSKCGAGSDKLGKAGGTWEHEVLDLVIGKHNRQLVITKYIIHRYRCKKCKKIVNLDFGVLKDCHFGFGFIATVMQSRIESKHSYSKILIEFSRWIPNLDLLISRTAIVDWFKRYGGHLEEFYLECIKKLKTAKFVHADETGLPMKGGNWWLWVIATTFFTLFIPHASRGHVAIEKLFEKFEGVLISDFWGAYNNLTMEQQKCLAHLIKDLKNLVMKSENVIKNIDKRLKEDAEQQEREKKGMGVEKRQGRPRKKLEPLLDVKREELEEKKRREAKKVKHALLFYLFFRQAWSDENNPLSYRAKPETRTTEEEAVQQLRQLIEEIEADGDLDPDIKRLIKRIRRYENYLFTYLKHPGIPPDNNHAERELRPFVIMRKTSHDFKSEEVMDSFTLYLSFHQTCKKNGVNFDKTLKSVLSGKITPVLKAIGF